MVTPPTSPRTRRGRRSLLLRDEGVIKPESGVGLQPSDAILTVKPRDLSVDVPAVRSADQDKPWVKASNEGYRSPETEAFVESTSGGGVLPIR